MKTVFKDGEMTIHLSLMEAIQMKGKPAQIKRFVETGKIATNPLKSILARFEEEYATVETTGKGENKVIILSNKRDEPIKINRGNPNPKQRTVPFANELDLLIIKALRDSDTKAIEGSIGQVMTGANMANPLLGLYKQPYRIDKIYEELEEKEIEIGGKYMLRHVLDKEHETQCTALLSSLERLRKRKLISWTKHKVAKVKKFVPIIGTFTKAPVVDNENNAVGRAVEEFVTLTVEQEQKLASIHRELMSKHDVTTFELINYQYSPKVQAFLREQTAKYLEMGIEYYFDSFNVQLLASEEETENLLEENEWMLEEMFAKKAAEYSLQKAENRQKKFSKPAFGSAEHLPPIERDMAEGKYTSRYKTTYKHAVLQPEFMDLLD